MWILYVWLAIPKLIGINFLLYKKVQKNLNYIQMLNWSYESI